MDFVIVSLFMYAINIRKRLFGILKIPYYIETIVVSTSTSKTTCNYAQQRLAATKDKRDLIIYFYKEFIVLLQQHQINCRLLVMLG